MIWLALLVILAAALAGAPLFAILMSAAMLGFYVADIPLTVVAIEALKQI